MTSSYTQLRALLTELFQLDQADLDFGVYRVMNQRRDEILAFLDDQLLPQVQMELAAFGGSEQKSLQVELAKAEQAVRDVGLNPDDSPKVKELRAKLSGGHSAQDAEDEIFSRLTDFFRRYYDQGDFLALPRYKEGVYAVPYNGEEVKLHWANADQYYIKSSEALRDYSFVVGGRRVHFRLSDAEMSRDNNKPDDAKKRVFGLVEDAPVGVEDGDIVVRFAFRVDASGRRQETLNALAAETVLASSALDSEVRAALASADPKASVKKPRTVLDGHLRSYTARNTFDYFIHKDLGAFLRRELDFYVKNEVLFLDDLDSQTSAARIEQTLFKVRVLRRLAHKLIDFLAQLEDFQKSLWLKKKFVVETSWGVTLDRVPAELYAEVAANDAQRAAWVEKFAIDAIAADTVTPGYSVPLIEDFLRAHPFLVLDTRHFPVAFTDRLLASFDDLDAKTDGLLVNGENFQALSLLQARYKEQVKCIYIDPPYNTKEDDFPYKDNYKHSSWLSMMYDRVLMGRTFLPRDGSFFSSIDENEVHQQGLLLQQVFGLENFVADLVWEKTRKNDAKLFSVGHEYMSVFAKSLATLKESGTIWREAKPGAKEIMEQYRLLRRKYKDNNEAIQTELREWYKNLPLSHPSKRLSRYKQVDEFGPWRDRDISWPGGNGPRYDVIHPITNKPCKIPERGWGFSKPEEMERQINLGLVVFREDDSQPPFRKAHLVPIPEKLENDGASEEFKEEEDAEAGLQVMPSVIYKQSQVAVKFLRNMMGGKVFANPKDFEVLARLIDYCTSDGDTTCDFFAGSGTTGHAVINLNRSDGGKRKYVLVEKGRLFRERHAPAHRKSDLFRRLERRQARRTGGRFAPVPMPAARIL